MCSAKLKDEFAVDEVKIAELYISGRMDVDELKSMFGVTQKDIKEAVRNRTNEAVNSLVTKAYRELEVTDPFVFNRIPDEKPPNWSSKYTSKAVHKKGTKIAMAVELVQGHYDAGSLTRANRARIIKEIIKTLGLRNEMTAATYFADAMKLAKIDYTG